MVIWITLITMCIILLLLLIFLIIFHLHDVTFSLGQSLLVSLVFYEYLHNFKPRAFFVNDYFVCVYCVTGTEMLYTQESQRSLLDEMFLGRSKSQPVTLSKVIPNTRALTILAVWTHPFYLYWAQFIISIPSSKVIQFHPKQDHAGNIDPDPYRSKFSWIVNVYDRINASQQ